jgi:hypothetical protein
MLSFFLIHLFSFWVIDLLEVVVLLEDVLVSSIKNGFDFSEVDLLGVEASLDEALALGLRGLVAFLVVLVLSLCNSVIFARFNYKCCK